MVTCSHFPVIYNISSRFPSNSEADASELLENLEEMSPWYYMHTICFNQVQICCERTTNRCVTHRERVPVERGNISGIKYTYMKYTKIKYIKICKMYIISLKFSRKNK